MLTFSINVTGDNLAYSARVWDSIHTNIRYFKKFNGPKWEEAAQKAYVYALEHRDEGFEDITPYIKKLARTILKVKEREKPYDMYTEDGEVALVFTSLTERMDDSMFSDKEEVKSSLKELYLLNTEEFLKLKNVFYYDDDKDILSVKAIQIHDDELKQAFTKLVQRHDANTVFYVLYEFFKELDGYTAMRSQRLIKDIVMKEGNYNVLSRISDVGCVKTEDGAIHAIDKNSLLMDFNPDYKKWDTSFATNCDIVKIDMTPVIDYMYQEVFVEQGVNTRHIAWCDDKYRLLTPGGYSVIGADKDKFMSLVRVEVILNIMMNNINTIIALSPDSIFLKPTRSVYFDILRLHFVTGKVIDLPVTMYMKKRKRFL